jgi:hypothetical protein
MNWLSFLVHDIAIPAGISYLSVYLDQKWHANREFKAAYAKARSFGKDSLRLPDKTTLDALFTASLSELKYRSEQAGKDYEDVLWQLELDVPGKEFRVQ